MMTSLSKATKPRERDSRKFSFSDSLLDINSSSLNDDSKNTKVKCMLEGRDVTPQPFFESAGTSISLENLPNPKLNSDESIYWHNFPSKYIVWTQSHRHSFIPKITSESKKIIPCQETTNIKVGGQDSGPDTAPSDDDKADVENMVLSVINQDGFLLDVSEGISLNNPNLDEPKNI